MPEDATGQNWVNASTADKSVLTIASGAITPTLAVHVIAAETGTTDNLDFLDTVDIPGPSDYDGYQVTLRADTGDTITLRHNQTPAGSQRALLLPGGADIVLDSNEAITLMGDSDLAAFVPVRGDAAVLGHTHAYGPDSADYLVGTANAGLSAEIVVGATPGGELGGTWASPTVDATHSGSAHHAQAHTLASHSSTLVDELSDVDTATDPPALSEVLKWNGSNWVPAAYDYSFAFGIASFTDTQTGAVKLIGSGNWKAIGGISFSASYNNPPGGMTAQVALSGSATPWGGPLAMTGAPPTGPTASTEAVVYPSGRTGTLTFTLSQSVDGSTAQTTQSFSNTMRYGTNANGIGAQTEANVEALSEVAGPNESRSQTISNIATDGGTYLTFSYADALSDAAQVQMDSGFGFVTASFHSTPTTLAPAVQVAGLTTVTNSLGFIEAFAAITSRLTNLTNGSNDFKLLTTSTAQNYLYWGELAKASGYTEADVEGNYATQPGKVASNSISSRSMTVNCGGTEYAYIAYPARLGALTSILIGGFESIGDFNVDNTALAVTNDAGYQENYRVYVSKNPGFTDPTTMVVTI